MFIVGGWSNCTWSVWQLVNDNLGIQLPAWHSAGNWYYDAQNSGYAVGSQPAVNSIICYKDNGLGHVAFVTAVDGNRIYIKEGGYYGGYHEGWDNAYGSKMNRADQKILGYIYLKPGKWHSTMTPNNVGDDIYSPIIVNKNWLSIIDAENGYLELRKSAQDSKQMWHFVRQSDGSYTIQNCGTGKYLDVYGYNDVDGGRVWTYPYNGSTAQKWYIYGRWSGEYILKAQCTDRVIDVPYGAIQEGTKLQLWSYNNSVTQQLALYPAQKAGSSTLSYNVADKETTFNWTSGANATSYNLRIQKGTPGNVTTYKDIWDIKNANSYSIKLPVGYYEVYIDSANFFSYSASNVVKFNITKDQTATQQTTPPTPQTPPSEQHRETNELGDLTGDKKINTDDARIVLKYYGGKQTLTNDQMRAGDINKDGKINTADARKVLEFYSGKIKQF